MARFKLHRRALLKGTGVAIGLPFMEIMGEGKARAQAAPKRYVFCYAGVSLTRDSTPSTLNPKFFTPTTLGPNYDLGPELSPLGKKPRTNSARTIQAYDVQSEVSVVSGLKIPAAEQGQSAEADGRGTNFHGSTAAPLVTGTIGGSSPSADQLVAEAIGKDTKFPDGVYYQIQPGEYEGGFNQRGEVAFKRRAGEGASPIAFYNSPKQIFGQLFGSGFLPPDPTPEQLKAYQAELEAQKRIRARDASILDLVLRRSDRLKQELGKSDRVRLEQHFDEIRALEKRVEAIPVLRGGASCQKLPDPGTDPGFDPNQAVAAKEAGGEYMGWSDEIKRAEVLRDMLTMALTCDLTRVGVMLITYGQSYMNAEKLCGVPKAVHGGFHGTLSAGEAADVLAWHVEQFAYLVRKLKDTPDADGRPMIDNTVITMGSEGGYGYDPEFPDPIYYPSTHSSDNMNMLVAGGRNLGFNPGRHIAKGLKAHPGSVLLSAMKAVGADGPLGNVTRTVDDL